jgi:hypothetical protein
MKFVENACSKCGSIANIVEREQQGAAAHAALNGAGGAGE